MEIKYINQDQIVEARHLQKECRELHLPSPPLVIWEAEVFDKHGTMIEKTKAKSNSYTRNGLNLLCWNGAYPTYPIAGGFDDGVIGVCKTLSGLVYNNYGVGAATNPIPYIIVGYGTTPEDINIYNLANTFTDGPNLNALVHGTSIVAPSFDSVNRIFYNDISRSFGNAYASSQDIKEIGLVVQINRVQSTSTNGLCLVLRDVLALPITVPSMGSIVMHYQFEVLY